MEPPTSSVLRLFVTAMCLFVRVFGALVPPCRILSAAWIDFFLVLEASSRSELELDSSNDVELPEDSESLLLLSERLIEEMVWLNFASEGDSGIDEASVLRFSIVIDFGVGASSDSESDEPAGIVSSRRLKIQKDTCLWISTWVKQGPSPLQFY